MGETVPGCPCLLCRPLGGLLGDSRAEQSLCRRPGRRYFCCCSFTRTLCTLS